MDQAFVRAFARATSLLADQARNRLSCPGVRTGKISNRAVIPHLHAYSRRRQCESCLHSPVFRCWPIRCLLNNRSTPRRLLLAPWTIATTYKADKFENCTMARTATGLGIAFVRNPDGLLLSIDSPKWKLDRGKAYSVRLSAASQSLETKALAESKSVTIALADRPFNERLRTASALEVRGEGATPRSAAGWKRGRT